MLPDFKTKGNTAFKLTVSSFISVKNFTVRKIDPKAYEGDASLRGEFVRAVLAKTDIDEARKREIITLGLKVLAGQEVEV